MLQHQPLGVFAAPATYLLLPDAEAHADLVAQILNDGAWPAEAPDAWASYGHALRGDTGAAYEALPHDDPTTPYNRFVLAPTEAAYATLKADADGPMRALVLAVGGVYGYEDEAPEVDDAWPPALRAFLLATRAGRHFRAGESQAGLDALEEAENAVRGHARTLGARLLATRARTIHELLGPSPTLVALYQQADVALKQTAMQRLHGVTLFGMGSLLQEMSEGRRALLLQAARAYQRASQLFSVEEDPERHALALNNLALAYLAMPLTEASDQLRTAIAVQALRDALKVYTRDTHPDAWASTTLNLANALQHAPSGNPEGHLWQAVELYEEVLQVRTKDEDPGAYARTLANQANALAHLGAFSRALPRFAEARDLFRALGDADASQTVEAALAEIAAGQGAADESAEAA